MLLIQKLLDSKEKLVYNYCFLYERVDNYGTP